MEAAVKPELIIPQWYDAGYLANVKVIDPNDGTYSVCYTLHKTGRYKLEVRVL